MKSHQILLYMLCFLILHSCQFNKDKKHINVEGNTDHLDNGVKLEIDFYPSSGGSAVYSIRIEENIFSIHSHGELNDEKVFLGRKLSDKEQQDVRGLLNNISKRKNVETEVILDSWRIELKIDDEVYYNESDVKIETLPDDIRSLVQYLLRDSTIEIDLYGFS